MIPNKKNLYFFLLIKDLPLTIKQDLKKLLILEGNLDDLFGMLPRMFQFLKNPRFGNLK